MAGGFSNTNYNSTVQSVLSTQMNAIKNPLYKWSDQNPTPVTYYNIDQAHSTLDEGSQLAYDNVGVESPFVFNKIEHMMLYGLEAPMATSFTSDEYGMEVNSIEGDATILPNTIMPNVDDEFIITYTKEKLIFRVTNVEPDTLDDGSNIYKIQYRSSEYSYKQLEAQVHKTFDFLITNVGTQYKTLIESDTKKFVDTIHSTIIQLQTYYKSIFYNSRVQAFTFKFLECNFYDPYLIEFLKRNNLMNDDDNYIYITHQTPLDPMFPVNYKKTVWNALETKDIALITSEHIKSGACVIQYPYSIFENRYEDYYEMRYQDLPLDMQGFRPVQIIKEEFVPHVNLHQLFKENYLFYNVIIKYLWGDDININDIDELDNIDFENSNTIFYAVPMILYVLKKTALTLLKDPTRETSI